MQAAASHASAMPPSSDCSAERENFSLWLRMAATKHSAIRARAASSRDHGHPRRQRGPSNGLHLSSFSRSGRYGAPRYTQRLRRARKPPALTVAGGSGPPPIPNLSMFLSTKCNGRINLRSMVRRIFAITLAGSTGRGRATILHWTLHICAVARNSCNIDPLA
jgi:hypothetical protein